MEYKKLIDTLKALLFYIFVLFWTKYVRFKPKEFPAYCIIFATDFVT